MTGLSTLDPAERHRRIAAGFMHTWDLATACGRDTGLDPDFATQLVAGMSGIEDMLRSSGQYGPAVAVAPNADPLAKLAGFIGRDPHWNNRSSGPHLDR